MATLRDVIDPGTRAVWDAIDQIYRRRVMALGLDIGFGNMMSLASQCWEEVNAEKGMPAGSAHSVGPCRIYNATCRCRETHRHNCDWCCGCGWVTPKVRALQDKQARARKRRTS